MKRLFLLIHIQDGQEAETRLAKVCAKKDYQGTSSYRRKSSNSNSSRSVRHTCRGHCPSSRHKSGKWHSRCFRRCGTGIAGRLVLLPILQGQIQKLGVGDAFRYRKIGA